MDHPHASLVLLYLPLLAHDHDTVRRQAATAVRASYGDRAITDLRNLLTDQNALLRRQARIALQTIADLSPATNEPQRHVYIECLGRLRIHLHNQIIQPQDWSRLDSSRAGWQKMQAVMAYLIHCGGRGTTRTMLGEAVWGDAATPAGINRALAGLRQVFARLGGEALADQMLVINRDHCLVDPAAYESDAQVFERLMTMATTAEAESNLAEAAPLYHQAVRLYGGPYMADIVASSWSIDRRGDLANAFVFACERLAEHSYNIHDDDECLYFCTMALDTNPGADDITAWMLRAYARRRQPVEVEHAFRRYVRTAAVDVHSSDARTDVVVQAYREINGAAA